MNFRGVTGALGAGMLVLAGTAPAQAMRNDPDQFGQYVGCYVDSPTRAMPATLIARKATLKTCSAAAKKAGYKYIGLQYGGQCYGGNAVAFSKVKDSECNMRCSDGATACGGFWRNSIWKVN